MTSNKKSVAGIADSKQVRLQDAYLKARRQQESLEVELNRARIIMLDADGKIVRLPLLSEH